jgi:hypothetical protein
VEEGFTAKAQREVVNEALNSKHEIRKKETQPRIDANQKDCGSLIADCRPKKKPLLLGRDLCPKGPRE